MRLFCNCSVTEHETDTLYFIRPTVAQRKLAAFCCIDKRVPTDGTWLHGFDKNDKN